MMATSHSSAPIGARRSPKPGRPPFEQRADPRPRSRISYPTAAWTRRSFPYPKPGQDLEEQQQVGHEGQARPLEPAQEVLAGVEARAAEAPGERQPVERAERESHLPDVALGRAAPGIGRPVRRRRRRPGSPGCPCARARRPRAAPRSPAPSPRRTRAGSAARRPEALTPAVSRPAAQRHRAPAGPFKTAPPARRSVPATDHRRSETPTRNPSTRKLSR